ncbi:MAG TPA: serine hydrolase domain-containing protein [Gemmataceae bacterium]|nr:serine hydrolase domain-containing protein [Gemmataceae bacterium]
MIRLILFSAAILFSFLVPSSAQAPKKGKPIHVTGQANADLASFDDMMLSFMAKQNVPGAALAVTRDGMLVYARGFGMADQMGPVAPRAQFRIASISKPITAVAIMKLIQEGKLKLDDRAFAVLKLQPFLPKGRKRDPRLKDITVRELLHHTGGWDRDKSFDPMFQSVKIAQAFKSPPPAHPDQIIRYMLGQPLDFTPGERYAYSNFGYCVLGRIIEKVSGESYEEYVKKHILAPLGIQMARLGKTLPKGRARLEVTYHDEKNRTGPSVFAANLGKQVPLPYGAWCLEAMDAHGGWISSAVDLVRFASAFDKPEQCKILTKKSLETMFARPQGAAGYNAKGKPRATYYACGWNVRTIGKGKADQWHTGALDGTATILVRRHDGLCWAVLFNTRSNPQGKDLIGLIDGQVHAAADKVERWPRQPVQPK